MAVATFLASPVLGNLSDHFGRRRILLLALGGLAVDYVLLTIIETLPCSWRGIVGHFRRQLMPLPGGDRRHHGALRSAPAISALLAQHSVSVSLPAPRSAVSGRDRPARAVRRRRDPAGEYALWLFHLSRNATPRTAPDVRLAACQPARRVANDARAARNGRRRRSARAVADRQPRLSDDVELLLHRAARLEPRHDRREPLPPSA